MKPAFHARVLLDDAAPAALVFFLSAYSCLDPFVFPLPRGDSLIWSPTPSFCEEREGFHAPQFQTLSFPPRNENRLQEFTLSFALRWPGVGAIADPRWSWARDSCKPRILEHESRGFTVRPNRDERRGRQHHRRSHSSPWRDCGFELHARFKRLWHRASQRCPKIPRWPRFLRHKTPGTGYLRSWPARRSQGQRGDSSQNGRVRHGICSPCCLGFWRRDRALVL